MIADGHEAALGFCALAFLFGSLAFLLCALLLFYARVFRRDIGAGKAKKCSIRQNGVAFVSKMEFVCPIAHDCGENV